MTADAPEQKQRQLDLLLALDKARDALDAEYNPNTMFDSIIILLKTHFKADACAIMILTESGGNVDNIVYAGTDQDNATRLCYQAIALPAPAELQTSEWENVIGMGIIRDENTIPLGGIFIANDERRFTEDDNEMLALAESQIDSAIVQARRIWQLANSRRELEAIFKIDRMRDENPTENELIGGFSNILTEYFRAELCMVMLSHADSGEMMLRGVVDKENVPLIALDAIRELTDQITIPQVIQTPQGIEDLAILAGPLIVSGVKFGAVVVGRSDPFTPSDHSLMAAMISQMDSSIAHSRVIQLLYQRNKELEIIYKIDHIRDSKVDLDIMLHQVLNELCQAVSTELGYLMLFSETEEKQLELKATTNDGILSAPMYRDVLLRYSLQALDEGQPVYSNTPDGAVRSIVAIPLILQEKLIGVFGSVNSSHPRGFSAEDRRLLTAITSQVDTAVFERLERRQMRRVLSRSVDPKVIDHLLSRADDSILSGERVIITMLFADLRGSTSWGERTEPEQLVATLNMFLGTMTDVIFDHGGTLDKFVGDEVIALFGMPLPMEAHSLVAMKCALDMQAAHKKLQAKLKEQGLELPAMGIGISTGEIIAGEIGSPVRTDFTALGRYMNLGARLCSAAGPDEVIVSSNTYQTSGGFVDAEELEPVDLKGIGTVKMYKLLDKIK
jgi:adenylate cyclase